MEELDPTLSQARFRPQVKKVTQFLKPPETKEKKELINYLEGNEPPYIDHPLHFLNELRSAYDMIEQSNGFTQAQKDEAKKAFLEVQDTILQEASAKETSEKYARMVNEMDLEARGKTRVTGDSPGNDTLGKQGEKILYNEIHVRHGQDDKGRPYVEVYNTQGNPEKRCESLATMAAAKMGPGKTVSIEPMQEKYMLGAHSPPPGSGLFYKMRYKDMCNAYYREKRDLMFELLAKGINVNQEQLNLLNEKDYAKAQKIIEKREDYNAEKVNNLSSSDEKPKVMFGLQDDDDNDGSKKNLDDEGRMKIEPRRGQVP